MTDYNSLYQQGLYLSPDQQDLLLAALSSNDPSQKQQNKSSQKKTESNGTPKHTPAGSVNVSPSAGNDPFGNQSGGLGYGDDDSPFLDFNPDADFDFQGSESLIGDIPESVPPSDDYEPGDKRKDMDGKSENENEESGGKKRRESDSQAKKPGRKPLTSEPTSKRKAQNRAAQRAFRERKEKHLKDLEIKVDELQKSSDNTTQENGLLRAQMERMQVELKEYRKRLSWLTRGNGISAMSAIPGAYSKNMQGLNNNEFLFDFPKFGDLPGSHIFNNGQSKPNDAQSMSGRSVPSVPGVLNRDSLNMSRANGGHQSPASQHTSRSDSGTPKGSVHDQTAAKPSSTHHVKKSTTHDTSNSDSPCSSSDSHHSQGPSSKGTSPEPSPAAEKPDSNHVHSCGIDGESSFCAQLGLACGNISNPIPAVRNSSVSATNTPQEQPAQSEDAGLDLLAQQNGGQFDPVLFGDWREPQDAVLSQDFGTFFDDAFPLPDLGSPSHNFNELMDPSAHKKNPVAGLDKLDEDEVVPGEDQSQMMSCNKIWDRLQSMDKFRNGEIDVDNLCSELRTKARCSEGGVVVNERDVTDIMGRVK